MKTIKVSEATPIQLDWLVAKREGLEVEYINDGITRCLLRLTPFTGRYSPTADPAQMWPIIERERMHIYAGPQWTACVRPGQFVYGPTSLIAAARCYVVSKLGETAEVPKELT